MHLTIGICGQVSSGKTSLVNAFCGGFVGSSALHRTTISPESFYLDRSGSAKELNRLAAELTECCANNTKIADETRSVDSRIIERNSIANPLLSYHGFDFRLIDFPSFDDTPFREGKFLKVLFDNIWQCDIIIYVIDANTEYLGDVTFQIKAIREKIAELLAQGVYCKLIVVVNKYDNLFDKELKSTFEWIQEALKLDSKDFFRISSHKFLIDTLWQNDLKFTPPRAMLDEFRKIFKTSNICITPELFAMVRLGFEISFDKLTYNIDLDAESASSDKNRSGDWDGLIDYLSSIDISEKKFDHLRDYIRERINFIHSDEENLRRIWVVWPRLVQYAPNREYELLNDLTTALSELKTKELFINILIIVVDRELQSELIDFCCDKFDEYKNLCYLIAYYLLGDETEDRELIIKILAQKQVWQIGPVSHFDYEAMKMITLDEPNWLIKDLEKSTNEFIANVVVLAQQPYHKLKYMQDKIDYAKLLPSDLYESLKFRLSDWNIFMLDSEMKPDSTRDAEKNALEHLLFIDIGLKCTFDIKYPGFEF